jgi:hypothetical protein
VSADDTADTLQPPLAGPDRLPQPDSAVGVFGGALLRFAHTGECLQLSLEGVVVDNVACPGGDGQLVGTPAASPLVLHRQVEATGNTYLQLIPAYGVTRYLPFNVGLAPHAMTPPAYPPAGADHVVLVRGIPQNPPDARQDRDYLAVVGPTRLALAVDSVPVWEDDDTRAAVPFGDTLYLLRFGQAGGPMAMPVVLENKPFHDDPYGFGLMAACAPTAELCDGFDNDCDGRPDNGRCCGQDAPLRGAPTITGVPEEMHVCEVENRDGVRVALRDADDHWTGFVAVFENGALTIRDDPRFDFHGGQAAAFVCAGGPSLLLTQDPDQITASWEHPNLLPDPALKPPFPLNCRRVLAAAPLDHTHPDETVVVACEDKFIRMSPWDQPEHADREVPIPDLPAGGADWITLNRPYDSDSIEAYVGYTDENGQHQIQYWTLTASGRSERQRRLPPPLQHLPPGDAAEPISLAPPFYRVAFQQRANAQPRMWVPIAGEYRWVDLRFNTEARRIAYNRSLTRAYAAATVPGPSGDQLAVYVVNVGDEEAPNAWSWEPSFTVPAGEPLWDVHNGDYTTDFVALYPDASAEHGWRLEAYDVSCEQP